jgi:hypothetical protein
MHIDNPTGLEPVDSLFHGFFHVMPEETADHSNVTDTFCGRSRPRDRELLLSKFFYRLFGGQFRGRLVRFDPTANSLHYGILLRQTGNNPLHFLPLIGNSRSELLLLPCDK